MFTLVCSPGHLSEQEHDALRAQIAELKVALEHAQTDRRRKIEYDTIAEKIATFPTRDELQQCVYRVYLRFALIESHQIYIAPGK